MIRPVMDGSFEAEYTIFNTSISIYIPFPGKYRRIFGFNSVYQRLSKIVKAERKTEGENKVVDRAHTDTPKEQTQPMHFCTFFLYFRRVYIYQLLNIYKCFTFPFPGNTTLSFDFLHKCIKDGFFVILVFSNL